MNAKKELCILSFLEKIWHLPAAVLKNQESVRIDKLPTDIFIISEQTKPIFWGEIVKKHHLVFVLTFT